MWGLKDVQEFAKMWEQKLRNSDSGFGTLRGGGALSSGLGLDLGQMYTQAGA
jgi:hypothetical protein